MRRIAFGLYLLFTVSWFLHIGHRIPALGQVRVDLLLAGLITVLIFGSSEQAGAVPRAGRTGAFVVALVSYSVVTVPFVEWPGSVLKFGLPNFLKAVVFYFFTVKLVTSKQRLRLFLTVFVAAQTYRVLEPLYLHVTQGYWGSFASMGNWEYMARLAGAPSDTVNPNGLAFVILTALPFLHYLLAANTVGLSAYVVVVPCALYTLVLTGSRSGFLGFVVVAATIWLKSRRKTILGAFIVLSLFFVSPRLSPDTADRFLSIVSANTKNAATAQSRWSGLKGDVGVALRRPIFGHGLGTSLEANANYRATALPSHNLYAETAQEIGFVGLTLFLGVIVSTSLSLARTLRRLRDIGTTGFLARVANALQVWLAMNILFSLASYGLSGYEWYLMAGLSQVLLQLAVGEAAGDDEGGSRARVGAASVGDGTRR